METNEQTNKQDPVFVDTTLSRNGCFRPQGEILSEGTNTESEAATFLRFLTHARVRQPNTGTAFNISAVTSTPILLLARQNVLEASSC
jgi:hypothetical protein